MPLMRASAGRDPALLLKARHPVDREQEKELQPHEAEAERHHSISLINCVIANAFIVGVKCEPDDVLQVDQLPNWRGLGPSR